MAMDSVCQPMEILGWGPELIGMYSTVIEFE